MGVRRLDGAPEAAPEVESSGDPHAQLPIIEGGLEARRGTVGLVLAEFIVAIGAERLLLLGKELVNGDAPLGLGFEYAHAGGPERRVLSVGGLH